MPVQSPFSVPIRVLLAEDDPMLRDALGALVDHQDDLELVGVAADAREAIALATESTPDVCLVDVAMPGGGGPAATRAIRSRCPRTQVLALSGRRDRETVLEMLRAGACGYLVKGDDVLELLEAIHAAAAGLRPVSSAVSDGIVGELADKLAEEEAAATAELEARRRVQKVLDQGLLSMAFQPIVALGDGAVMAYEALARITSEPVRGPELWFAEATAVGLGLELELAAAGAAIDALDALPDEASVAINLSPAAAVSPELLVMLPAEVGERVIVEITEHAPIDDYDAVLPGLARLRQRGVRIAIDDAGAGFASLRHILRLQPDVIKADMSLTRSIAHDRSERALTRALISFAAETGALFVAEGIETDEEIVALHDLGVAFGQGFKLGAPQRLGTGAAAARSSARR